ncbi:cAMP-dependent protein kinase regulatory subunit [Polytolypa hystricis UAMH7299]|uniref:cAMP-dependent protein kinase regulatory subunit n=1 Tax=Polytolypa hystricis (strain UAMH7299) TaxID=1447883 RepID=A0A2B7YJ03_POLH7|nr:cAMP-dependent protein kinase regulatory subunit [Polytolypa hystricis UAMH7299]
MSQSRFPGSNLFGSGGFGERSSGGPAPVSKIVEEDEGLPSPTDPTFRGADPGRSASSSGESYFRGGGFGEAAGTGRGSFARNPFGGAGDQPEGHQEGDPAAPGSFRPTGGTHEGGLPNNYALGRRTSVSAESLNPTTSGSESWTPPYHPKNPEQLSRLQTAVSGNFLFSHLDEDQFKTVLDALVEKPIPAKDIKVITQGDAGDFFYIVEEGVFDIFIHPSGSVQPGTDGLGTKVNSIGPGGSFGELALMYNAPRAATVVSTQPRSTLWALDRITFRRILMDSAFQRRRMYEAFLEEVPLLSTLKPYERAKIADALDTVRHPAGATIIREGDRGTTFYLLESGEAEAYKEGIQGPVKYYERGDFFGELALLDDKPRAASIVAKTDVKVAQLGRDGFKRLLGPVQDIMRRAKYDTAAAAKEGE